MDDLQQDADALARALVAALLDEPDITSPGPKTTALIHSVAADIFGGPLPTDRDLLAAELNRRANRAAMVALFAAQIAVSAIRTAERRGLSLAALKASLASPYSL